MKQVSNFTKNTNHRQPAHLRGFDLSGGVANTEREVEEGGVQGDPKAGGEFNVAIQKDVVKLEQELKQTGGLARFGQDDGYGVGHPDSLFPGVRVFSREVEERCGLELVPSKSELYCKCRQGTLPPGCLPGVSLAGMEVDGQWENGFVCYGVPIGSDSFVKAKMKVKVEEVKEGTVRTRQVLGGEKQALWTILRQSFVQQLDWWLTLLYPSQVKEAALELDKVLWEVLECCASSSIPKGKILLFVFFQVLPQITNIVLIVYFSS